MSSEGFFIIYQPQNGGTVWQHELVNIKATDYAEVFEIAVDKANIAHDVYMLPTLPDEYHPLRKTVFAGAKMRKCPDLKINGVFAEVKSPIDILHENKINNNIKFAHEQADHVIIRLHSNFDIHRLAAIAKGRLSAHKSLITIEFKMGGKYYSFNKKDFK